MIHGLLQYYLKKSSAKSKNNIIHAFQTVDVISKKNILRILSNRTVIYDVDSRFRPFLIRIRPFLLVPSWLEKVSWRKLYFWSTKQWRPLCGWMPFPNLWKCQVIARSTLFKGATFGTITSFTHPISLFSSYERSTEIRPSYQELLEKMSSPFFFCDFQRMSKANLFWNESVHCDLILETSSFYLYPCRGLWDG